MDIEEIDKLIDALRRAEADVTYPIEGARVLMHQAANALEEFGLAWISLGDRSMDPDVPMLRPPPSSPPQKNGLG